jgi:hypothetical protein
LAILSGATVQVATTTATSGVIGICVNNCTASASNAQIAREGTVLCAFDSSGTTAGDYVQIRGLLSRSTEWWRLDGELYLVEVKCWQAPI